MTCVRVTFISQEIVSVQHLQFNRTAFELIESDEASGFVMLSEEF